MNLPDMLERAGEGGAASRRRARLLGVGALVVRGGRPARIDPGANSERSIDGAPSVIHSDTSRPVAGECWKPWPPKPTATKKPSTPGAHPMIA